MTQDEARRTLEKEFDNWAELLGLKGKVTYSVMSLFKTAFLTGAVRCIEMQTKDHLGEGNPYQQLSALNIINACAHSLPDLNEVQKDVEALNKQDGN